MIISLAMFCLLLSFVLCAPLFKAMYRQCAAANRQFVRGTKEVPGFKNGADGNFYVALFYMMMLPLALSLVLTVIFYGLAYLILL